MRTLIKGGKYDDIAWGIKFHGGNIGIANGVLTLPYSATRDQGNQLGEEPSSTAWGEAPPVSVEQVHRPPSGPHPSPWRGFPRLAGLGSPPFRRDGKSLEVPRRFEAWAERLVSNLFRGTFLSREAGFRIGWRRCSASPRRGHGRMRACTLIRPWPAGRGRSLAPPPASLVARSALPQPRTRDRGSG